MSSDAAQQVRACLSDEDSYKKGRKKIIQQIDNGNRLFTTALVDTVKVVLKDKKEPGVSKFIALYFLKEAMDTKDPDLVNYVKEKILSRLGEIAKSDTAKIFPSKTEDKILRNFDQLLLECIYFWAEWFGAEKGGSKYKSTLQEVKQKVEMPKKHSFFVTKKPKKEEAPPETGKAADKDKREESKQASSKPGKKDPIVNKIETLLKTQEGNKEMLMESISGSNKPDLTVLQLVNDQFTEIDKELQDAVNALFSMEFPEKESILNRVLEETSFTSKYLSDYKKLQKKQISMDEFKSAMLVSIGSTKGQTKGKEDSKSLRKAAAQPEPQKPSRQTDWNADFNSQNQNQNQFGGQQNAFGDFNTTPPPGGNAFENFGGSSATRPNQGNQDFGFGGPNQGFNQQQQQQNAFGGFESAPQSAARQQGGGGFGHFEEPQPVNQGNNAFGNFDNPQQQNFGDFNNFGGNQRPGRPNVMAPPPNEFNQQGFDGGSAGTRRRSNANQQGFDGGSASNRNPAGSRAFDTPFDHDEHNQGFDQNQGFNNNRGGQQGGTQGFEEFGSGWDPNPPAVDNNQNFNQNQGGRGGNQGFNNNNQEFGQGWDNNNQGFDNRGQQGGFDDHNQSQNQNQGFQDRGQSNQEFGQGWDNNQGFNENSRSAGNQRNNNNQEFDQGWDNNNQGFNENRRGAGNQQSQNNQGFDNNWDNNNQGFDNNQNFNQSQGGRGGNQGFDNHNQSQGGRGGNQGFDNNQESGQGWDNNNQGFNENRRGAGNQQSQSNQGFDKNWDNNNQGFDNNQNFNQSQGGRGGKQVSGGNQDFDQGWDNNQGGFDNNQNFNQSQGGRGGNQGFNNNNNNQDFGQGWDNNNQGFDNRGQGGFDSQGANNTGFNNNQGGFDNNNQGFDNHVPFQNAPVLEPTESLRGIRGKPKEQKPATNNFDDIWDSGNLEAPTPPKTEGGVGFDDFADFSSGNQADFGFNNQSSNQQSQQPSRNQSQGFGGNQQGNQRSEFGDAFEWGAPPQQTKPYQSPPTGSFNTEFNNDFRPQEQQQPQYQQDNQFGAPKRFDSFGGETQQAHHFGGGSGFDNFAKPEVHAPPMQRPPENQNQHFGAYEQSPSLSNLNQNFGDRQQAGSNFNTNEPRRDFPQRHDFTQDLNRGLDGQFNNQRPPIRNEMPPPPTYNTPMGGAPSSGFNMGRSTDAHSNYNPLSTNTLVAQNTIPAKMGDMESERLRRERDKILSELENVKRLYNGLKVDHDFMKMNNNAVSSDYNRVKYEVDDLKRTKGELSMNTQQLRMENEGFRNARGALSQENAGHMRMFEDMSREIAQLKSRLTEHDVNDRQRRNEAHVMNVETSLKNAQFQVESMQTLHSRVANEYNKANSELDKLKLGHYTPAQTNLPNNLIPQIQANAQSIGRPSFSPPRARSRSPVMDLMNILGDPMPSYGIPTRTSIAASIGQRYSPTKSDVDRRLDYQSGNVLYSSPPRAEQVMVNNRASPPRLPESLYGANVDRTIPPLFSKYLEPTNANQPIGLQEIQPAVYDLSRLPPIPDKYTRTSVTPMYHQEQGYTFQAQSGPLGALTAMTGREVNLVKSTVINPAPGMTNPSNRKASDLIEKAKRLRESASRGGDSFRSGRESVNVRTSIPANEGRYLADEYVMRSQTMGGLNPSSVYQTATKVSPGRGYFSSMKGDNGLNMDDLRKGDLRQSNMNRSPPSLTISHTKMGGLPQGLYRGSPVRERIVNREEVVELKPTESLKIVERPVRMSPNRTRGKSPVQGVKTKSDENTNAIGQNAASLAQTLKNDIQMFKRGMRGSPEAATINPRNNQYEQEGGSIANKYQYGKGSSVEATLQGVTISANDFGGLARRNERLSEGEETNIRQVSGVPTVKLTVGDNYFQGMTTPNKYFQEPVPVRESGPEGVTQYNIAGKKLKGKQGKKMVYDHGLFDQFTNTIYGYTHSRDVDAYKSACLTSRATLFDSPNFQITAITKNENDEVLKSVVYFTNKSNNDISEFSSYPMDTAVQSNPQVQGATLTPKYQLKQELFIHFMDFRAMPYILDVSYRHENSSKQMNLALPITINKFLKFRHGVDRNAFKGAWKQLKARAVTTGYRNINAKFIRNPVEITKYFDNNLLDVTPHLNPKHKKKYAGIFVLPDHREYYLRLTMDASRIKILASSGQDQAGYEEWVVQYLSFLLTV